MEKHKNNASFLEQIEKDINSYKKTIERDKLAERYKNKLKVILEKIKMKRIHEMFTNFKIETFETNVECHQEISKLGIIFDSDKKDNIMLHHVYDETGNECGQLEQTYVSYKEEYEIIRYRAWR